MTDGVHYRVVDGAGFSEQSAQHRQQGGDLPLIPVLPQDRDSGVRRPSQAVEQYAPQARPCRLQQEHALFERVRTQAAGRPVEVILLSPYRGVYADVAADDHRHRYDETSEKHRHDEGRVRWRSGEVIKGARGLEALGDVAIPAEQRRDGPEEGMEPWDEQFKAVVAPAGRGSPVFQACYGNAAVQRNGGQSVDGEQAEKASRETV